MKILIIEIYIFLIKFIKLTLMNNQDDNEIKELSHYYGEEKSSVKEVSIFENPKLLNIPIKLIDLVSINVFKNIIILFHNLIIVFFIFLILQIQLNLNFIFILFGIAVFLINSYCISIVCGLLCLRYKDFILIIKNFIYLMFLVTPIFWLPEALSRNRIMLVDYNIMFQIVQSIRDPLLGNKLTTNCLLLNSCFSFILLIVTIFFYKKFHKKALFWI